MFCNILYGAAVVTSAQQRVICRNLNLLSTTSR